MSDNNTPGQASGNGNGNGNGQRKRALTILTVAVLAVGAVYGGYAFIVGKRYESTDNAYVNANVVQITPLVGGTVTGIYADDTDFVKAGQKLVSLDPADARVALDQAESALAQTVREVRTLYANNSTLDSQVKLREADLTRAQTELTRAKLDESRRAPLVSSGAVGKEELEHARTAVAGASSAVAAAQSALQAARDQALSNRALTDGIAAADHPNVQRAAAKVREAYLALQRAELPAPVDGWIARRSVQVGQRVGAGSPLMAVVGLRDAWVDANFKESQIARLRIGQKVRLDADVYGSKIEFDGTIQGLSAGTGAAFALLPAQNATGNWIKVVQRVPVRIALDPKQVAEHPLRVGLSMEVTVDVQDQSGKMLTAEQRTTPAAETTVFSQVDKDADALVQRIVKANLGGAAKAKKA
ncbi:MAG: HlyD family efflux transporter periplasmic adaptor subunit [Paucibacter sp.]|nr:HlyD family efflux transporter periplasmic adaptor subunit [Roseateles sp.]